MAYLTHRASLRLQTNKNIKKQLPKAIFGNTARLWNMKKGELKERVKSGRHMLVL